MSIKAKHRSNDIDAIGSFLSIIMFLGIVFQGVYFPVQYLLFTLMLLFITLLIIMREKKFIEFGYIVPICTLFFTFYALVPSLFAPDHYSATLESVKMLAFLMSVFIVQIFIKDVRVIIRTLYYACLAVLFIGLLCYIGILNFPDAVLHVGRYPRMQSVLQYANTTAILMAIGFVISYYNFDETKKPMQRAMQMMISFLFLIGLFLTMSKGAIAIFFVVIGVFLIIHRSVEKAIITCVLLTISIPSAILIIYLSSVGYAGYGTFVILLGLLIIYSLYFLIIRIDRSLMKKLLMGCGILIVVAVIVIISIFCRKFSSYSSFTATFVERMVYMSDAFRLMMTRPLTGIGAGNWSAMQYSVQSYFYSVQYVHNSILQVFLDSGLIGGVLFLIIISIFYIRQIKYYVLEKNALTLYVLTIVTLLLLHSLMDMDLSYTALLAIFGSIISTTNSGIGKTFKLKKPFTLLIVVILSFAVTYLMTGQIVYNRAVLLNHQSQYNNSLKLCKINNFFMPMSSQNNMLIADNILKLNNDYLGAIGFMDKAHELSPYNKDYYITHTTLSFKMKDYSTAYIACERLTHIDPLIQEHYFDSLELLEKMKQYNQIEISDFDSKHNELLLRVNRVIQN